jgi:RNA polymerase sigma factor (sigma-70 family)
MRSDAALVRRFRAGDESAFAALHARYAAGIRSYADYMLRGSPHEAEDAAQDVFLRAYQALRRDERDVDVRPWLYRIAHNRCVDVLRRPVGAELREDHEGAADSADPAATLEQREAMRALLRDIGGLPEGQRSALLLRELGGLSHKAVAEALGISLTSSRMLVHRARTALVDAAAARNTACAEVRDRVVAAADGGPKLGRGDRRHLEGCMDCAAFRRAHGHVERELSLLTPAGVGLTGLLKILWGGGAGVTGGGAVATTATGGAGAGTGAAAKLTVGACCALLAGGGAAVGVKEATTHAPRTPKAEQRVAAKPATRTAPKRIAAAATPMRTTPIRTTSVAGERRTAAPKASRRTQTATTAPKRATTATPPVRTIDLADAEPRASAESSAPAERHAPTATIAEQIDLADLGG